MILSVVVFVTAINVHDLTLAVALMHAEEGLVYGDAGYQGIAKSLEMAGKTAEFRVAIRLGKRRALPALSEGRLQNLIDPAKANVRAKVEYTFRVIKHQFGFQKTRLLHVPILYLSSKPVINLVCLALYDLLYSTAVVTPASDNLICK